MGHAGARVIVVGRAQDHGDEAAAQLRAESLDATFVRADASERGELRELVSQVLGSHHAIDVLVNGAGINSATPFLDVDDEELERIVAVNQLAVMRSCQEFGRYFVQRATDRGVGASIINIGSVSGINPLSRVFTYSMTKAAVHNLTKNLAREWGPLGIRCNVLVPGFFPAEQNRAVLTPDRRASILQHTPLGRFGGPDDLAGAVVLLASDEGRFITGAELVVDGGFGAVTI